jgi:coenzyme F420 hydrogenase subunit beta
MKMIINPGFCLGCGTCVASCPFSVLDMVNGKPKLTGRCEACGICFNQCPQTADFKEVEKHIFGRNAAAEEAIGIYRHAYSVKAKDPDIAVRCQDGGAVTALLAALLEKDFIDGAIVTGTGDSPWLPKPFVATMRDDLLECAGTKYSRGVISTGLRDAVDLYQLKRVAFVGMPCQIRAIRRMKSSTLAVYRLADAVKICIGIFCVEALPYEAFFKKIVEGQLGIKLADVAKFDIKQGKFAVYCKGKPKRELDVGALRQFVDTPCKLCFDFASDLADISVGAVGSPLGCSTVLTRTEIGEEAFELAKSAGAFDVQTLEDVKPSIELVKRLSLRKMQNALGEIERRRASGQPLPVAVESLSGTLKLGG